MPIELLREMCDCTEIKELSWCADSKFAKYIPTQGVIQDAIKVKLDFTRHNIRELFWIWYSGINGINKQHWTDQELWIAFYMYVIHKKFWQVREERWK